MKTKIVVFLAISAVITLSFTFASVKNTDKKPKEVNTENQIDIE